MLCVCFYAAYGRHIWFGKIPYKRREKMAHYWVKIQKIAQIVIQLKCACLCVLHDKYKFARALLLLYIWVAILVLGPLSHLNSFSLHSFYVMFVCMCAIIVCSFVCFFHVIFLLFFHSFIVFFVFLIFTYSLCDFAHIFSRKSWLFGKCHCFAAHLL